MYVDEQNSAAKKDFMSVKSAFNEHLKSVTFLYKSLHYFISYIA